MRIIGRVRNMSGVDVIITQTDIGLIRMLQANPDIVRSIEQDPQNPLNNLLWDLRQKSIILRERGLI